MHSQVNYIDVFVEVTENSFEGFSVLLNVQLTHPQFSPIVLRCSVLQK